MDRGKKQHLSSYISLPQKKIEDKDLETEEKQRDSSGGKQFKNKIQSVRHRVDCWNRSASRGNNEVTPTQGTPAHQEIKQTLPFSAQNSDLKIGMTEFIQVPVRRRNGTPKEPKITMPTAAFVSSSQAQLKSLKEKVDLKVSRTSVTPTTRNERPKSTSAVMKRPSSQVRRPSVKPQPFASLLSDIQATMAVISDPTPTNGPQATQQRAKGKLVSETEKRFHLLVS